MAVKVIFIGVVIHHILTGHQGLNPTLHERKHQPHVGESLVLQRSDHLQKVLHFAL